MRRVRIGGENPKSQRKNGDLRPRALERPMASRVLAVGRKRGEGWSGPKDKDEKEEEKCVKMKQVDGNKKDTGHIPPAVSYTHLTLPTIYPV